MFIINSVKSQLDFYLFGARCAEEVGSLGSQGDETR